MNSIPFLLLAALFIVVPPVSSLAEEAESASTPRVEDERLPEARRLARFIAARILDGMDGRTWLVAPGINSIIAEELRAEASARSVTLRLIDKMNPGDLPDDVRTAIEGKGGEFSDACAVNPFLFCRLWMERDKDGALRDLALLGLPALWTAGGAQMLPSGLVFLGTPVEEPTESEMDDRFEAASDLWGEIGDRLLDSELEPATTDAVDLRAFLRRHTSRFANELGVLLDRAGKHEEAFEAFTRALRLDSANLSAQLNRASAVKRGIRTDLQSEIVDELNRRASEGIPEDIAWSLALQFGPVTHPEDFVPFGWAWAMSGLAYGADPERRAAVLDAVPEEHRKESATRLDAIQDGQIARTTGGLKALGLLVDPKTRAAAALVVAGNISGGTSEENARRREEWIRRAAEAGASAADIVMARFKGLVADGNLEATREFLEHELSGESVDNPLLWRNLVNIYANGGDVAALEKIVESLASAAESHPALAGPLASAQGVLLSLRNQPEAARGKLLESLADAPKDPSVLLMILRLDFQLGLREEARGHATALIELLPGEPFANYVLGSLAFAAADYETAVQHLARSVATDAKPYALNDLACALCAVGRNEEALKAIEAALQEEPKSAPMLDTYAAILIELGRWDDAYRAVLQAGAFHEGPPMPELRLREAAILLHKGDEAGARKALAAVELAAPDLDPLARRTFEKLRQQLESR